MEHRECEELPERAGCQRQDLGSIFHPDLLFFIIQHFPGGTGWLGWQRSDARIANTLKAWKKRGLCWLNNPFGQDLVQYQHNGYSPKACPILVQHQLLIVVKHICHGSCSVQGAREVGEDHPLRINALIVESLFYTLGHLA